MRLNIATHNKIFHADEVTAIALLRTFTDNKIVVSRVNHDTADFSMYDIVIDIGRKFDGEKYFDHHQYKGGKSSAGLIWDFLELKEQYPKISQLMKMVDDNDVGISKAKPFEYSSLIRCFNHKDIYEEEQDRAFEKAVDFAMTVLRSMKSLEDAVEDAKAIVSNSFVFNNNPAIMELSRFTPHWTSYINGEVTPNINAVVWEDVQEGKWKVKIPTKRLGTFELHGKALLQDKSMDFVHSNGHFAVAKDEKTMKIYLAKQNFKV